jgi:hypothetical protein
MQREGKLSRDGITRFEGHVREFDGKVTKPGGLEIAMYEGLMLLWSYWPEGTLDLFMTYDGEPTEPVLSIPLAADEIRLLDRCVEKGGWGYYELHVEPNDDRAAVNMSFMVAKKKPVSMLWILDRERREELKRGVGRFLSERMFGFT